MNDVYVMFRINGEQATQALTKGAWPAELDTYEAVIRKGAEWGHAARYGDPLEMWPIAVDLVGQRPTISDADLAGLLQLDLDEAARLAGFARRAIAARGYPYPWQDRGNDEYDPCNPK